MLVFFFNALEADLLVDVAAVCVDVARVSKSRLPWVFVLFILISMADSRDINFNSLILLFLRCCLAF